MGGKGKGIEGSMRLAVGNSPKQLGSESTNSKRMQGSPWVCSSSEGRAVEGESREIGINRGSFTGGR